MEGMDEVLRAGETVVNRRKQSQKRKENAATVGSHSYDKRNWFSNMLSIPPRQTLTTLQVFTLWSAIPAYFLNGILGVILPEVFSGLLFMRLDGRDLQYWKFDCASLAVIGFFYIVTARSRPAVTGNGAILGTVPERLVFVVAALAWLSHQSLISLPFAVAFAVLDSTFAIITYIIWSRNTPGASVTKCLAEIAKLMIPIIGPAKKWSSNCMQIIGYLQMVISLTFMVKPEMARDAMSLDAFEGYAKGLLSLFFMQMAIIGWFHVLGGGDGNEASPNAAVFYRLAWEVPFISLMYYFNSIERGFALAVGGADLASALIVLISLGIDALPSKTEK